ncbi:hypothetical protein KKF91_14085 [Myxococcota bacterium]|nr:hypothetical protein [Myxococcota bacterium]MBU1431669.1 hypothetical protein [Myxococcota bacterium]MBU1899256.1 hypothetical protein [Myxococcota bacterium]
MSGCLKFGVIAFVLLILMLFGLRWAFVSGAEDWLYTQSTSHAEETLDRLNRERIEVIWRVHVSKKTPPSAMAVEAAQRYKSRYGQCKLAGKGKSIESSKTEKGTFKITWDVKCEKVAKASLNMWFEFDRNTLKMHPLNFTFKEAEQSTIRCPLSE